LEGDRSLKVQSSKFKVQSSKFKVQSSKFKVQSSKFKKGRKTRKPVKILVQGCLKK
jgi:phosphate transport system substrate-binding protein